MTLQNMKKPTRDIMTTEVVTALPNTKGDTLAHQLLTGQFSGLPVVDENKKVLGIVTEFDLLKALRLGKNLAVTNAKELMTIPAICVNAGTPIEQVLQKMIDYMIIRLPVVEDGQLVGVVSRPNILSQIVGKVSPELRILSFCYWCEKVRDDLVSSKEGNEMWSSLEDYLKRHHLQSSDVTFSHVNCPTCSPMVKRLMGDQQMKQYSE